MIRWLISRRPCLQADDWSIERNFVCRMRISSRILKGNLRKQDKAALSVSAFSCACELRQALCEWWGKRQSGRGQRLDTIKNKTRPQAAFFNYLVIKLGMALTNEKKGWFL